MPRRRTRQRDIERAYSKTKFIAALRRLADTLESGKRFSIRVAGERVRVPANATISIEHELSQADEEIEFQLKWQR